MRFSEIIGKKIVCLSLGKELGTVFNCSVDKKMHRILHLATIDKEEDEGFVDNKRIFHGKDILYTLNCLAEFESTGINFPFRSPVYNTDGSYIGRANDFEFEGSIIKKLYIDNDKTIESNEVVLLSSEMIIIKGNRKLRIKREHKTKPKELSTAFNQVDNAQSEIADSIEIQTPTITTETPHSTVIPNPKKQNQSNESPLKVISGYGFLLGRAVIKHIFAGSKLIIPKGKIIDADTVEKARTYGKLVELTVSSVKEKE